jgi:Short C-terminal domain/Phospholipase_D-nuclease N-terminal
LIASSNYPFIEVFWTMLFFFCFVIWIWILFTVFADLFRRRDIGGWGKTGWIIFVIVLPYLGVFVYLIAEHKGMADRNVQATQAQQDQMDAYVRSVAGSGGGAAAEIEKAKTLLDSGAITQAEFDSIKAKALGS